MKNNKFSLKRLFSNTKFLLVFSLVVAFIFWMVVSIEYSPVIDRVIEDVPVSIDMKDSVPAKLGLEIFGVEDFRVNVNIRGNKLSVGGNAISSKDISVVAQTSYVNSAGNHMLQLTVSKVDPNDDFEITGYSSDYIEVFFDKRVEKEFELVPVIKTELEQLVDDEYLFNDDDVILKTTSVKLSGAQTEINKVDSVSAVIPVDKKLTECITIDADIVLNSEDNNDFKYVSVSGNTSFKVPVTLPVYKVMYLSTGVSFVNSPTLYLSEPIPYTVSPSEVKAAVLQNGSFEGDKVNVGKIDFNELSPDGYEDFIFDAGEIANIKTLDDTDYFTVSLDISDFSEKEISVSSSDVSLPDSGKYKIEEKQFNVTVSGPLDVLDKIEAKNISLTCDSSVLKDDKETQTVKLIVKVDDKSCWVYGDYYITVSKA